MKLHEEERLFRQAIFIEKDYWVTYALHSVFMILSKFSIW